MSLDADSVSDVLSGSSSNRIGSDGVNSPVSNEQRREIFDLKDEDMCGVVYGSQESCLTVGLMNLKTETSHMLTVAAPDAKSIDYDHNYSFALVGYKLFAIGSEPTYPTFYDDNLFGSGKPDDDDSFFGGFHEDQYFVPQPAAVYHKEVYSCDLSPLNSGEALKFERVATLQEPKIEPLLVPYKDKLFIIADPCLEPKQTKTPCEILRNLNEDKPIVARLNPPPFWEGILRNLNEDKPIVGRLNPHPFCEDSDASRVAVKLDGHVVVKNRLYVRVETREKRATSWPWYCLNMDTEVWEDCDCVVPFPSILNKGDKRPFTYVHGEKLFELDWDENSSMPTFKVGKLKDGDDDMVVDLKDVVEFVGLKGFFVFDAWVLPCDEHNADVFCLMIWLEDRPIFEEYIRICKFKLGDDGSFRILTKQIVTFGPFPPYGKPFVGFTPAITKVLNPGHYETKLYYKESERLEAHSYKDFVKARAIKFKDDIFLEEEEEVEEVEVEEEEEEEKEEEEEEEEEEDDEEEEDYSSYVELDLATFLAKLKSNLLA
ncbi:hypothetical protein LINGRAPRIM_LOCUS1184 [Linum grandiflorum]